MADLEARVKAIEARNNKVENDKAWETSWVRRLSIAALTYGVVVTYLLVIGNDNPFINAGVPPLGFLLSTLVMRTVRQLWEGKK
jgi:hypothetical protein